MYRPHLGAVDPLAAGLAVLQSLPCYSQDVDDCIMGRSSQFPDCATLNAAWAANKDAMNKAVDAVPFCAAPASPTAGYVAAAAFGVTAGLLLSFALRGGA